MLFGACALLLSAAASAAGPDATTAPVKRVPIEIFADEPFLANPILSPDGKEIAAEAFVAGESVLFVFRVDDFKPVTRVNLGEAKIAGIDWAGSSRILLTISTKMKVFDVDFPVTRLFDIELPGGETKLLDARSSGLLAGDVLYVDPAGAWILVSSQNDIFSTPSVKRIDLPAGTVTRVEKERPDVWNWYADTQGVVRAGISYQSERWTMWYREKPGDSLRPIRARNKSSGDDGAVDGMYFLADTGSGVIVTNAKTGRFGAYKFDLRTAEIGDPIYENAEVDVTGIAGRGKNGDVDGISYQDDRRRVAWLDPAMRELQAKIDAVFPGAENVIVNGSADGNRQLIWSGSASDPGTYYVFDRAAKRMARIVAPYEKLADVTLSAVAPVRYAARDGLSIPGYLTLPRDRPARDLPLIVFPHGGPFARDTWDYDPYVQFLADRGYAVLQPEFRGSTGYGKTFVERGYGQWGRAMQDDIDDGVDWLVKSGKVDSKRVCVMGASYGGYAALWGAIRNPERYRCAVSLSGVTDLPGMLRYDRRSFAAPRYFRAWQSRVKGEDKIDLDSVSPLAQAARLNVPVLIAHGEKDDNVPSKQAHQMVAALQKRKAAVESVFYPKEGHGLRERANIVDFLTRLEAFLAKNNPA